MLHFLCIIFHKAKNMSWSLTCLLSDLIPCPLAMPGPWQYLLQQEQKIQRFDTLKFFIMIPSQQGTLNFSVLPGDWLTYTFRKLEGGGGRDHKCLSCCPKCPVKHRLSSVLEAEPASQGQSPFHQFSSLALENETVVSLSSFSP